MLNHPLRNQMKKAFQKVDGTYDKKELYRLLQIAEDRGFTWNSRVMYGGGTSVGVYDQHDEVASISIFDNNINVTFNDKYFHEKYVPTEIIYLSDEQLAEVRNEEVLYGYEMPHYRLIEGFIQQ